MESTKDLITPLLELGLNKYESRVYLSLITEGTSTAKNVSSITGIPYGKVYEIITSLSNKGFCILLPSKPMKCKAVSPQNVVKKTKEDAEERFHKLEKQISNKLEPLFGKTKEFSESKGVFWVVNGRSNIIQKVEELMGKASQYIQIYTTENGLKRLTIHKNELLKAKERELTSR
ncbi:MAG: helix-turn-helix domain-containing protein [Candidatus Woesearchaeota archaeon]